MSLTPLEKELLTCVEQLVAASQRPANALKSDNDGKEIENSDFFVLASCVSALAESHLALIGSWESWLTESDNSGYWQRKRVNGNDKLMEELSKLHGLIKE